MSEAIINSLREPLLVVDRDLRVILASRSFYRTFAVNAEQTQGRLLSDLGDGQWDIPSLRVFLDSATVEDAPEETYELERKFPGLGQRTMQLNVRKLALAGGGLVIAIGDVTERRAVERERNDLLRQKDLLFAEMEHRVANSLAIISSILLLKARSVSSEETRSHLEDARRRVMSVASVQMHLHTSKPGDAIELEPYLAKLCTSLAASMINGDDCTIETKVAKGNVTSSTAVSIGLIVTELVINALKHAFPEPKPGCAVIVSYEVSNNDWKLSVADNGCGTSTARPVKVGLGTTVVTALASQLDASVHTVSGPTGTTVSITHAEAKVLPEAA